MKTSSIMLLIVAVSVGVVPASAQQEPVATAEASDSAQSPQGQEDAGTGAAGPSGTFETWQEMVNDWLTPRPVPKDLIVRIDDKYAFPHAAVSLKMEIVREDDETVWLRGIPPEDPHSPLHRMWLQREVDEANLLERRRVRAEYGSSEYLLDFDAEIVPPPFMDSLEFEASGGSLPTKGLWQMNFAVDDMNGDGIDDLVFPPRRKGTARPAIYLGAGDGEFSRWQDVSWPKGVPFDYGGIATGDFDGDGHRDLALAIHFKGQYVMHGDGAGGFGRPKRLPSPDPRVTSRAVTVADFDGDGDDDLAFLAELDYDKSTNARIEQAFTTWIVKNTNTGWRLETAGMTQAVIGDNITSADVDRDGRIDLVLSSNHSGWRRLVYFNRGDEGWKGQFSRGVLSNAHHFDVVPLVTDDSIDIYASFVQFKLTPKENLVRTGVIRYVLGEDGLESPSGPIVVDDNRFNHVFRIGAGDLNGDGLADVVIGRKQGGLEVYLQGVDDSFTLEKSTELAGLGRAYDIKLIDLNGDGRDELVASFAQTEDGGAGGVRVFFARNRV